MSQYQLTPYEGDSPYIFISYCHKDSGQVYRCLEYLQKEGFRLWFDNGINPGEEWPDVIAAHLDRSAAFLSFISQRSMESHNCRREFNFAMMENKPSLTVILEPVMFTPVMKMQLASIQAINSYELDSENACYMQIEKSAVLRQCKGEESLLVSRCFFVKRESTGEQIRIGCNEFKIGRKKELCDYIIENNKTVSRVHGIFYTEQNQLSILDNQSLNKIYVNGRAVKEGEKRPLKNGDRIDIGGEIFIVMEEVLV